MRTAILASVCLLGCSSPSEPVAPVEPAPEPAVAADCAVSGVVKSSAGVVLSGRAVSLQASEARDERRWTAVYSTTATTDADGRFSANAPCGTRIQLRFEGWNWGNEPTQVLAEPSAPPLDVVLFSERKVRLLLTDIAGAPLVGTLERVGGAPQVVPVEGLALDGVGYGQVAGTVAADGVPPRVWRLNRSDQLNEVEPQHFVATLRLGPEAPLWVHVPEPRDVSGVWCIEDGRRGATCKLRESSWFCECGAADRVGVATKLWEVGLVRDVPAKDLQIEAWPEVVEQCIAAGDGTATLRPAGVDDRLLLGTSGPAGRLCVDLPKGEKLEVVVGDRVVEHVPVEPGHVEL